MKASKLTAALHRQGKTLAGWCKEKGYRQDTVLALISGERQGRGELGERILREVGKLLR